MNPLLASHLGAWKSSPLFCGSWTSDSSAWQAQNHSGHGPTRKLWLICLRATLLAEKNVVQLIVVKWLENKLSNWENRLQLSGWSRRGVVACAEEMWSSVSWSAGGALEEAHRITSEKRHSTAVNWRKRWRTEAKLILWSYPTHNYLIKVMTDRQTEKQATVAFIEVTWKRKTIFQF